MKRAFLLYNPESGRRRERRLADVRAAAETFRAAAVQVTVEATTGPGSGAEQAQRAIAAGYDAVVVCGGDGSVNDVLPAVVGTPVALGVVPLGTANGLANDLGLPRHIGRAAQLLVSARTRRIPVPRVGYTGANGRPESRYWMMGAGVGADAYMAYRLTLEFKRRWGMAAYYSEATRQWLTHEFPMFVAEFRDSGGQWRSERVSQVLAVRITWFGGLLAKLAPGAALTRPDFQLVLFKTRRRMSYLRYMMGVWTSRPYSRPDIEVLSATECHCLPLETGIPTPQTRIYAEADGEVLATIPVSISMSNETVNLLVPPNAWCNSDIVE